MQNKKRLAIALLAVCSSILCGTAQKAFFVDGFHGGVYGHYPMKTYTRFLTQQMRSNPDWRIGLEIEPETWDSVRVVTPGAYLDFQRLMTTGQAEYTNPAYGQPYMYNISGESIIRQFAYGIRKIRAHFPTIRMQTYATEEPCFTSALPTILRLFGFKYAVLKNPDTCFGGYMAPYGGELVNWIGPDGNTMLTVPRYECEDFEPKSTWQTMAWKNSKAYLKLCRKAGISHPVGMTYQDAGWTGGPWLGRNPLKSHSSRYVLWTDYIEKYSDQQTNDSRRFTQDDVRVALVWGSQVMQRVARNVRKAENALVQAEKMAAMAGLVNGFMPDQKKLDEGWRTLMLAQHHDSWICPYNNLNESGTWAENIVGVWTPRSLRMAKAVGQAAIESYSGETVSSEPMLIRVFNTTGQPRKEPATVEVDRDFFKGASLSNSKNEAVPATYSDGKMTFMADVPAFGYATYYIYRSKDNAAKSKPKARVRIEGGRCEVKADKHSVVFDLSRGGVVKSLVDNADGHDYAPASGAYSLGELRGYIAEHKRFVSSTEKPAKATILEDDSLCQKVKIEGTIAGSAFTKVYSFKAGSRRIEVDLRIDWKQNLHIGDFAHPEDRSLGRATFYDTRYTLNLMLPASTTGSHLFKDAPFDIFESKQDSTFFNRWQDIKNNVILHWADAYSATDDRGLMLLSDHTTSYSFGKDYPLALTLQYSGGGLWGKDYKITGPTQMSYAIVPHQGRWDEADLESESATWNEPLLTQVVDNVPVGTRSLLQVPDGCRLSSVSVSATGCVVRVFAANTNIRNAKLRLRFPVASVKEVDLLGNVIGTPQTKSTNTATEVTMDIPQFGLKTYMINLAK